jgi:hypothetical protein
MRRSPTSRFQAETWDGGEVSTSTACEGSLRRK